MVTETSDLGILRRNSFSYTKHINNIATSIRRLIGMVMKIIETKNRHLLTRIYTTYIRPKLEYATVIWNTHLKSQSAVIEKVQKAFSKRLKGLKLNHIRSMARRAVI